ncbi:hypothetical protein BJY04DRAFT_200789 [Aspergillus karnatakaensis]|uniref:uncharacterized protein n=1 Tax=Aspergillus karnatakaensis TaxID=1810916 RepID=UPI003CCDE4C4
MLRTLYLRLPVCTRMQKSRSVESRRKKQSNHPQTSQHRSSRRIRSHWCWHVLFLFLSDLIIPFAIIPIGPVRKSIHLFGVGVYLAPRNLTCLL